MYITGRQQVAVVGAGRTPREVPAHATQIQKSTLEEQGGNHHTIAQLHVLPQPEVNAFRNTLVCLSDSLRGLVKYNDDK